MRRGRGGKRLRNEDEGGKGQAGAHTSLNKTSRTLPLPQKGHNGKCKFEARGARPRDSRSVLSEYALMYSACVPAATPVHVTVQLRPPLVETMLVQTPLVFSVGVTLAAATLVVNVKTSVPCFEPSEPVGQTSSPVLAVSLIVIGGSSTTVAVVSSWPHPGNVLRLGSMHS